MEETEFIWLDGQMVPWKEAKIHVLAHALHYGSGVFEGIRCYMTDKGTAVVRLQDHIKRLFFSATSFRMKMPYKEAEIAKAVIDTIRKNELDAGYIRPIIFYGYGKMGLNPVGADLNIAIAVWPWGSYLGENAIKVKTVSFIRTHPKSTNPDAKITGNYANSIFCSIEAKEAGVDEALVLDYKGEVSEGPGENVFWVKKGTVFTIPLGTVLPGITRKCVMDICADEGIKCVEKDAKLAELKQADEAFYTGTAAEVTAIGQIDSDTIGEGDIGPITKKLRDIYLAAVKGKNPRYGHWLTYA